MERRAAWFQLVAVVLVVVGMVTLAAPAPAHAMDPQLILAMASAAGAIALIVGYLIVSNGREKQRAASLEGVYACGEREASGPMGCAGGQASSGAVEVAAAPQSPQVPMTADPSFTARADALLAIAQAQACASGQAGGPMGCGGSPDRATVSPTSAPAVQGQ